MATREAEVPTLAPALTPGRPVKVAETDKSAAGEWTRSGAGGSAFHTEVSWRTLFSRGNALVVDRAPKPCRNDGHGGAHGNGETREPAD